MPWQCFLFLWGAQAPLLPTDFGWDHRLAIRHILLAIFQSLIRWSFTSCDLVFRTRSSFSSAFGREKRVGGEVSAVGGPPATSTSTYLSIWLSNYPTVSEMFVLPRFVPFCLLVFFFFCIFSLAGHFYLLPRTSGHINGAFSTLEFCDLISLTQLAFQLKLRDSRPRSDLLRVLRHASKTNN